MVYRKSERSYATMNWHWPHQVALSANCCHGHNYVTIQLFCEPLSLCRPTHSSRRDGEDIIVFSFAERGHAEQFSECFGGELIDPGARPMWPDRPRTHPTDISLADRQRNGRCGNCAD